MTSPALVWAILSAVGERGSPPSLVVEQVHRGLHVPEAAIRDTLNDLLARGHLILDGSGTLRRVPESGIKAAAIAYGLSEDDVAAVFHVLSGAVLTGDAATLDAALRQLAAERGTTRRSDA